MAPTRVKNATPPAIQVDGADGAEIEVIDGAEPGAEQIEVAGDEQAAAPPDPGIEDLRKQLEEERRARAAAESEASTLRGQQQHVQREVADSRVLVLDATIQRQEGEKSSLVKQKIEAKEAGDYALEAEIDDKLQQLNIDLKQTRLGKARLEQDIESGSTQSRQSNAQPGTADAVEEMITRGNLDPRSASWLRLHPEYSTQANNDKLVRAHAYAMSHDGVAPASDEYFRLLEERLGMRQGAAPAEEQQQEETRRQPTEERRQPSTPAAPVSRAAGMGGGGREIYPGIVDMGGGRYRVSPAVQEAADIAGLTIKEYIDNAKGLTRGSDGQMH